MSSPTSPLLSCPVIMSAPDATGGPALGHLEVPVTGTVVLDLTSPRPLLLYIDGLAALQADLHWRRYERLVRATVVIPLEAGLHPLRVEYGPRPSWPTFVERDCLSRNREKVRIGLQQRLPDLFTISARVASGVQAPACALRYLPTQCVQGGVTWQHLLVTPLPGFRGYGPTILHDRPGRLPTWAVSVTSPVAPHQAQDATTLPDLQAGVRRLLVPVANAQRPLPQARADGYPEDRLEPESAVVDQFEVSLDDATPAITASGGDAWLAPTRRQVPSAVTFTLPVHEGRGRLAPQREHRQLAWPAEDDLLAAIPQLVLPEEFASLQNSWEHGWRMFCQLRRPADALSGLPNDYIGSARDSFMDHLFVWDSCFVSMALAWGWRAFPAHANLDCLYSRQFDGGHIPRETDVHDGSAAAYEPDFSPNPPLFAVTEWKIAALTGDRQRLAQVYPVLVSQHRWMVANRQLPDGTFWTTGLANGLDNSPSLGDGYVCLTAQMAHDAEVLGLMATALGDQQAATSWEAERQAIGAALNRKLWNPERHFYCTSLTAGGHNPNKIVTGFWPLWTGLVPAERVEHLAQHLLDPKSFWRHHPVPSVAADSPDFIPGGDYWRGSTWAPTNAAVIWGFERAGRHDLAVRTALRHLTVLEEIRAKTGALWENYTSEASAKGSWSNRDYPWTAVGPIALLIEIVMGLRPDALQGILHWTLPDGPGWGIKRLPLGKATIDLTVLPHRTIEVQTDQPFILEILDHGALSRVQVQPGAHQIHLDALPIINPSICSSQG